MKCRVGVEECGGGETSRHEQPGECHAPWAEPGVATDAVAGGAAVPHAGSGAHKKPREREAREAGQRFVYSKRVED